MATDPFRQTLQDIENLWAFLKEDGYPPDTDKLLAALYPYEDSTIVWEVIEPEPQKFKIIKSGITNNAVHGDNMTGLFLTDIVGRFEKIPGNIMRGCTKNQTADYRNIEDKHGDGFGFSRIMLPTSTNGKTITHLITVYFYQ